MGMFGKQKTDEEKTQELFEKFGLDIESYDAAAIKVRNTNSLKEIASDLLVQGMGKFGMKLSMASMDKQLTVGYLSAIFQTNLILVRQNELIIRSLEKIAGKK